jgi:hypothetical protein
MRTHERPAAGICPHCGFDFSDTATTTALALLLDLPREFRDALHAPDDALREQRDEAGWTAIEYGAHVAEVLHSTRKRLVLVFEHDDRNVSPPHLEAVRASARTAETEHVLASVGAACRDVARLVGNTPDDAWEHTARADNDVVTARDILTDALHEAHHHARDAKRASGVALAHAGSGTPFGAGSLAAPPR